MHSDYDLLIQKLDAFTRKYYKDRLIRGALYTIGLLGGFYLGAALLEYVGRFGSTARTALFWSVIAAAVFVVVRFMVIPLVKLFRLGQVISHEEAARIIGLHFAEVRDKLLNTLQLRELAASAAQRELIEASIAQRSRELSPVSFSAAIDLGRNRRYLRYALPPLLVLAILLFAAPSLITDPTQRLLRHGREFVPEAPFRFVVLNDPLQVPESEDFELMVQLDGAVVPQQVSILYEGHEVPLVKENAVRFAHRFRNVQAPIVFRFEADGSRSEEYTLNTVPNPMLQDFSMAMHYPAYLGMENATTRNTGDVTVPAGTRITWTANTRSSDRLDLVFDDTTLVLLPQATDRFSAVRRFLQSRTYGMRPANAAAGAIPGAPPVLQYRIEVVPDLYPTIALEEKADSLSPRQRYFRSDIGDDHGFKRMVFHYRFTTGGDSVAADLRERTIELAVDPGNTRQTVFHAWDLRDLTIVPGDRLEYWFEVWDNDGVNGSKSTRSAARVFEAPTLKALAEEQERSAGSIKEQLQQGIQEARELQHVLDKLRREMQDKKDLNFQDQQKLQNVLDRQKELQQRIEKTTQELRQSQQQQQEFRQMDERLLEKQQQVQELFENVLSEEMKELYRQVQEMLDKLDKEKLQQQMEDMKLGQEDIEKELDRSLEMFKQMEVEQKAQDIAEQLEKLAQEQRELGERTEDTKSDDPDLRQQQDSLNKAFEDIREQMDELEKKNQELEKPMDLPDTQQKEEGIQQEQQKSSDALEKKQNQKAGQSQKSAAEQMEQLAFQMKSGMQNAQQEQQEEDMDALRQLLENIVQLSFDQERVMSDLGPTSVKDPRFVELGREQKELRDDARLIEDSLLALSKRVPQLQAAVNREMNQVNEGMENAIERIGEARANERQKPMAADQQQHAMTSLNNLALLLDEALRQMQQQQQNQKPGNGSCNKPGGKGSSPSMSKMRAQQQALSKQLEQMKKALEEGKQKGPKPGQKNPGGMGLPGMSQQLAQLAAQQAAIRKEMQRLAQDLNKDGSGSGNGLNELTRELEQLEKDIVNKRIDQGTLDRQQDIVVRMLEHERAEREREMDNKRQSREGEQIAPADPARFFDYQRTRQREAELLRTVPPGLRPYYRQKVDDYFGTFDRH